MSTANNPTTYASPRPSLSIRSPSVISSTRTSLEVSSPISSALRSTNPTSTSTTNRRNRAALRDYYNLKSSAGTESSNTTTSSNTEGVGGGQADKGPLHELDSPNFEAGAFVKGLLEREGLEGVLKVEGLLVGEIRGLDGERKALVYDNYSRLILAAETILKMRSNIDPMMPTTSTLAPAVAHIVDTATLLSTNAPKDASIAATVPTKQTSNDPDQKRQTVRWVLAAPDRLAALIEEGKHGEAERDWKEVRGLLEAWEKVPGASEIRDRCQAVMADNGDAASSAEG